VGTVSTRAFPIYRIPAPRTTVEAPERYFSHPRKTVPPQPATSSIFSFNRNASGGYPEIRTTPRTLPAPLAGRVPPSLAPWAPWFTYALVDLSDAGFHVPVIRMPHAWIGRAVSALPFSFSGVFLARSNCLAALYPSHHARMTYSSVVVLQLILFPPPFGNLLPAAQEKPKSVSLLFRLRSPSGGFDFSHSLILIFPCPRPPTYGFSPFASSPSLQN